MNTVITAIGKRVWWQQVLLIMLITLVVIQLAGAIGTKVFVPIIGWSESNGTLPAGSSADSVEGRFARWDSGYYLQIAEHGYEPDGTERAFFPLYPLLIYVLSSLGLSTLWGGLLISVACFVGAGLLLYQWIQIDYGPKVALWSVIWLCAFPMSFFFSSLYAESLLMFTSVAAMYFARRGQFITSGVAIALAGATRPTAFLLAIPFVIEFWQQKNFTLSRWVRTSVGAAIAPLGVVAYFLFLAVISGTGVVDVYRTNLSTEWGTSITWPWSTLYDGLNSAIFGTGINVDWFSRLLAWHDLGYALLGMVFAIWGLSRIRLSAALFLLLGMLFFYANHGPYGYAFWSIPRRIASLFPIYLILVLLIDNLPIRYRQLILVLSIGMLILLSAWFATGRWVA